MLMLKLMIICDNCGEGVEVGTWDKTLEHMRNEGWQKKKKGNSWNHYCPSCREDEKC